jgi:hypothetical protein
MSCLALVSFSIIRRGEREREREREFRGYGQVGSNWTYFEFVDELLYGLLVSSEVLGRGRHIGRVKERSDIHRSSIHEMKVFIVSVSTEVDQRTALGNLQNCFSWRGIFIGGAWVFLVSSRSSSEVGLRPDARLNMLLKGAQQRGVVHSFKKRTS